MGEEIATAGFNEADFERFADRLRAETELAGALFSTDRFSQVDYALGFEIEAWIVDHNYFPASINQRLLETLAHPLVVPELSRFNIELNCAPLPLAADALDLAAGALSGLWAECNGVAHTLDANMVMIGTLPTIRNEDLTLANMSPLNRFYALNNEVLRRRRGRPMQVDIAGRDHLVCEHRDVMLEAATTSFQIHLTTPAPLAHRYYNAAIAASGPILAACGNAPFLFGKSLWDETRIPLFEQAVDLPGAHGAARRVTLGSRYLDESCHEIFIQNLNEYPVLLPIFFDSPPETLRHLRLHNGTIWRWIRPLIGFEPDWTPHLRIEHRILPAGPSICDMMANTALYLGLTHHFVTLGGNGAAGVPFGHAVQNFYAAARHGLDATLFWPGVGTIAADRLLQERLLACARRGLDDLGIDADGRFLNIIEARLAARQTGASWQRDCFAARGRNVFELMATYCERQRSGLPVHEWEV
ncbi:MAG: hypothetical protein HYZ60_02285 [Methylocystis sp.]|nr:hypothetical protein [Methylocystis sp.]